MIFSVYRNSSIEGVFISFWQRKILVNKVLLPCKLVLKRQNGGWELPIFAVKMGTPCTGTGIYGPKKQWKMGTGLRFEQDIY